MKILFVIFGTLSLLLGVLGIFLPLLPTTPFLLLSATLYLHSSPRLYRWLIEHKTFGSYIRNYKENKAMARRTKITIITALWLSLIYSMGWVVDPLWAKGLLLAVGVGVSWHILRLKTI
ncbi:MAG: YbaN family protein [Rikenellaceae bacterium]